MGALKSALLLFLVLSISGCVIFSERHKAVLAHSVNDMNYYLDIPYRNNARKIMLLPVYDAINMQETLRKQLNDEAFTTLNSLSLFEVIFSSYPHEVIQDFYQDLFAGKSDNIKRIAAEYGADGVIFMNIKKVNSFKPKIISAKFQLLSISEGRVVWSVDDTIDLSKPDIKRLYSYWTKENLVDDKEFTEQRLENSFQTFISFALSMFFQTMKADKLAEQYPVNV